MVWTPPPFELNDAFRERFPARSELQQMTRWWEREDRPPLLLVGAPGAGMTWLTRALARSVDVVARRGAVVVMRGFGGVPDIEAAMHTSLLSDRGLFLFEDAAKLIPMRYAEPWLRMLRDARPAYGVAIATRPHQADVWPSDWERLELRSLTEVNSLAWLQCLTGDATIGELHRLAAAAQGSPALLRALADLPPDKSIDEVLLRITPGELLELLPAPLGALDVQESVRFRLGLHDFLDLRTMLRQAADLPPGQPDPRPHAPD